MTQPVDPAHQNPPLPPGLRPLTQPEVTGAMTAWAERTLADVTGTPFFTILGPRLLGGKIPIVARVEWHPPDPPVGPNAWHRGVTLYEDQRPLRAEGVDVSHYQGLSIDWEKEANAGKVFMYAKASEGGNVGDDTFARNMSVAKAAGILRGAYHFFRPAQDPHLQATFFLSRLVADPGDLPPWIDVEVMSGLGQRAIPAKKIDKLVYGTDFGVDGVSPLQLLAGLATFALQVKGVLKRRPIIYTAPGFWANMPSTPDKDAICSNCDVAVADWNSQLIVPSGWTSWLFWQWAGDVSGQPGIPGFADLDRFNGTPKDLLAYATQTIVPPPPPTFDLTTTRGVQLALSYLSMKLKNPALNPGTPDGIIGPMTTAALIAFQTLSKATDIGDHTRGALQAAIDKARGA